MAKRAPAAAGTKRATTKKATTKRTSTKRTPAKRAVAKRTVNKRAVAKRAVAKRAVSKRGVAKRAVAKRAVAKRAVASKRAASKRAVAKKANATKRTAAGAGTAGIKSDGSRGAGAEAATPSWQARLSAWPAIGFSSAAGVPGDTEAVAVGFFAGRLTVPGGLVDIDMPLLRRQGFEAKLGETRVVNEAGQTTIAIGLGEAERYSTEAVRRAGAALVRSASHVRRAAFVPPASPRSGSRGRLVPSLSPGDLGQALAEGASLATYEFSSYKSSAAPSRLRRVTAVVPESDRRAVTDGMSRGARVARAVALARDLVNEPARAMTPRRLAEVASVVAQESGLDISVLDEKQIADERLGGLAGVAQGSEEPPRLIRLTYEPEGGGSATVALVGKGITFDSGGLSLKTADGMMSMKTDMSGAAAVLATMSALRDMKVDVRVVGIMPTTENMPSGRAIKPGDVLRARNGKTIEVLNTDAEGRLVLADGLSLAAEERPNAIVDLATLTGACVVALGRQIAGLMGNDDRLIARVKDASERAGEQAWHLPLPDEYRRHIDSEVADIKNIGNAGQAGALAAGLFLREFVGQVPWAHLDIAGPARSDADEGYLRKGGTGFGVRTLIELLSSFSAS